MIADSMNINHHRTSTFIRLACLFSVVGALGVGNSNAQFVRFAVTNADLQFGTIQASGAAAQHALKVSVRTNGTIVGSGTRYNVASNAVSPVPATGTIVSVLTNSRLGGPVTSSTNVSRWTNTIPVLGTNGIFLTNRSVVMTNWWIETTCPGAIFLTDGAKLKGVVSHNENISQEWDYNRNRLTTNRSSYVGYSAEATYNGGFGSGLSWSNPFSNP